MLDPRELYSRIQDIRIRTAEDGHFYARSEILGRKIALTPAEHTLIKRWNGSSTLAAGVAGILELSQYSHSDLADAATHLVRQGLLHRFRDVLQRPIHIIGAPRSGSTLLFETLAECVDLWTLGRESSFIVDRIPELRTANRNYESNALTSDDATESVRWPCTPAL